MCAQFLFCRSESLICVDHSYMDKMFSRFSIPGYPVVTCNSSMTAANFGDFFIH